MKTKLMTCMGMLFSLYSYPSTYYVSSGGQNTYAGSDLLPWKTLQYAVDQISAGDTVIVKSGNYDGFVLGWDAELNGNPGDPIVFMAQPGTTIVSNNSHTADGINLEGSSYIVIEGFTITNSGGLITRAGIRSVGNTGVVIRNNTIIGMGTWGIFSGFSENILIENNSCSQSIAEHGIYFSNSADNPVIRNNVSFNNHGCGIHMNGDASMEGDGIISNALIEGNIIYNNGSAGGSGINCDGVQNSIFRNNLLYNNHAGGITFYQIDAAEPARNNLVVNNTIYMASDGRWSVNIANGSSNCRVFNNILFTQHSYRGGLSCDSESLSGLQSDYNICINKFTIDDGDNILSLEDWQNLTGQDQHSAVAEPNSIFQNAAENNYHLISGCLAVNKGISENAPSVDIEGHHRPFDTGIDIGAYEFVGSSGITESNLDETLQVYPNPVKDYIIINSEKEFIRIDIMDMFGRTRKELQFNNTTSELVNISDMEDGTYIVRILCNSGKLYYTKILK
jgi:parallel beta-helix repeat protein